MQQLEHSVRSHYARPGLVAAILDGAERAGAALDALTPEVLAPVDEFHTAGRHATLKALSLMRIEAGMHILDAGCGIGGTARHLAAVHGCQVTGIDLTPDYIDAARRFSDLMRLDHLCRFDQGSVTDLPHADASFDAAVSFHVGMNVAQRGRFYAELARVLRPGAELCLFDVMKGPGAGMAYPVPWAETAATSFLRSCAATVALLDQAGFAIVHEENLRAFAIDYFRQVFAQAEKTDAPPPLGLHLLTGANSVTKFRNYAQALDTHQIEPVILVARRKPIAADAAAPG